MSHRPSFPPPPVELPPPPPPTPRYDPPPPTAMGFQAGVSPVISQVAHRPYELKRTIGRIVTVSAGVVLLLAVWAFVSGRGFSLTAGEGGPSVRVDAPLSGPVSQDQIDRSQDDLRAQAAEANQELARESANQELARESANQELAPESANQELAPESTTEEPDAPASADIAGEWFGDSTGGGYLIEQVGDSATITEFDGFGNITAVGQGTLTGSVFRFTYTSAAATTGTGELTLDEGGNFLNGFWEDGFGRRPAQLSRL